MAEYRAAMITDEGKKLIGESIAKGFKIEFLKMVTGSGEYTEEEKNSDIIRKMTDLRKKEQEFGFSGIDSENGMVKMKALITNQDLETGYKITEIGVFARMQGTDTEGNLYAVSLADQPDYFPDKNSPVEIIQSYYMKIENAEFVTISMSMGAPALAEDLAAVSHPEFENKTDLEELESGESIFLSFGKIAKAVKVLKDHITKKATKTNLGHVKITDDNNVVIKGTYALDAIQNNPEISGSLANLIDIVELQTVQSASQNLITNILLVDLNNPLGIHNRPGVVTLETNTSGDFPAGCLWGVRETFWHSKRNLTIKVTGVDGEGYNRIWVRSFVDGSGWSKWTEPVSLLLKHTDSGDHDGRYYTESEIDSLLSTINTQLADCLKSVGDGKIIVANAITAQGVSTATDAAFSTLAANVTIVGNTRYNTGYSAGVTDADNRANPSSNNYKTGYNAGVTAADARVNTSSASYTTGYNTGVTKGRNDVKNNPGRYGLYTKAQYDTNYDRGYDAGVTAGKSGRYIVKTGSFTASPGSNSSQNYKISTGLSTTKATYYMSESNDFSVTKISNTECRVWGRFDGSVKISWVAYGT